MSGESSGPPEERKKERMGGCWMNAFHIILVGRWCSCVSFRRSELCCQSFLDFFWSGINDKTQHWQRSRGNVAYYRLPLARVSALFHIHRCGPVCVCVSPQCLVLYKRIIISCVSQRSTGSQQHGSMCSAFILHLANKNKLINVSCCYWV